jgi:signal transduction histidine kinase
VPVLSATAAGNSLIYQQPVLVFLILKRIVLHVKALAMMLLLLFLCQAMQVQAGEQRLRDVRWRRLEIAMLIILVVLLNGLLQPVVVLQTRRWFGIYIRTGRQVNGTGGIMMTDSTVFRT